VTVDLGAAAVPSGGGIEVKADAKTPRVRRSRLLSLGPSTVVAGFLAAIIIVAASLAPFVSPYAPNQGNIADALAPIASHGHLLGTDGEGRDILSRLIWGARLSLLTGFVPVGTAGILGTSLGLLAGQGSPRVHAAIMRTLDVFYAFPAVLLAIAIAASLGSGIVDVIIALTVILVPPVSRIAETETVRIRNADFMESARSSGARWSQISVLQVLPNVAPAIVVYCTTLIGLSIVYAAGLGFLGLGVSPPTAEWGLMISDGVQYILTAPVTALAPAVAILISSVVFNILGDGLRRALDVRSERAPV
jgi:peptide/nickel transport system permease protein